ncbi:MAG: hypothetical protein ACLR06_16155 [Christensenellaceae bacterium]
MTLVGKQLKKVFFKTAVQIPIDASDIVSELIFAIIGEFHRLTVCLDEVFPPKYPERSVRRFSAKVSRRLKNASFK